LPEHLKNFQGHIAFQRDTVGYFRDRLQGEGAKQAFAPLEIGTKNQKFLENLKSASWFRLILA